MTLGQALQNMIPFGVPVLIYALFVRFRSGIAPAEILGRLGLKRGDGRVYLHALAAAALTSVLTIWISSQTSGFKGSMLAPFVGAAPTPAILASALMYGFLATGFPEELLFRGLIAGALFRRTNFWRANVIQASIFLLPHLLILFLAPRLWPLIVFVPLGIGLVAGWLRHASGSIWPSVLLHAVPNAAGALWVMHWSR